MPVLFSLLFLFRFSASYANDEIPIRTAVIFVVYDYDESSAFKRVQAKLKNANVPYRILAIGPAVDIFKKDPALIPVYELTQNNLSFYNRNQTLNQRMLYKLIENISAKVVYTGMTSRAQAQIANIWHQKNTKVVGFYDNFESVSTVNNVQPFLEELKQIDEFHVPSKYTADSFGAIAKKMKAKVLVTGQPVLEEWDDIYQKTDAFMLRNTLDIDPKKPVVLFAGGGGNDYPKAFEIFIESTRILPDVMFLVVHHASLNGELEQRIIDSRSIGNVHLLSEDVYPIATLSTISSAVIVHKSSIAQKAIYKNKPVVYVADKDYQNFMLTEQLAVRASSAKALATIMMAHINGYKVPSIMDKLNLPDTPSREIFRTHH